LATANQEQRHFNKGEAISKPIKITNPVAFWRVLARFDVFVMPFWGAPGEFALFKHGHTATGASTAGGHG
jgi:hypothetical protein